MCRANIAQGVSPEDLSAQLDKLEVSQSCSMVSLRILLAIYSPTLLLSFFKYTVRCEFAILPQKLTGHSFQPAHVQVAHEKSPYVPEFVRLSIGMQVRWLTNWRNSSVCSYFEEPGESQPFCPSFWSFLSRGYEE